jgi:hypothetical protein
LKTQSNFGVGTDVWKKISARIRVAIGCGFYHAISRGLLVLLVIGDSL